MPDQTWQTVRFGDMAQNINERILPEDAEGLPYVGLEHLDPESLKIRRWGTPHEVEAQKLRFYSGDIIFGKRRYYQKKLAVADFEGICSAHAMVLRAKPDVVLPDFLPFFMQSELFFERAMAISVGSLSPTINWSALARQEFALPPLDKQHWIAEILWATEESIEAWRAAVTAIQQLKQSIMDRAFSLENAIENDWKIVRLKECAFVQTGIAKGKHYDDEVETVNLPYLRVANVQDGYLDLSETKMIEVEVDRAHRFMLQYGDVLMTEGGDWDKLGRGTVWRGEIENCLHQNHVFCVRVDRAKIVPEFLSYQGSSSYGKAYFIQCSKQTTNLASINSSQVQQFPVLLPPLDVQKETVAIIAEVDTREASLRHHLNMLTYLKRSLLKELLLQNDRVENVQRA
jgi:type I restriction enzyme, S subunit